MEMCRNILDDMPATKAEQVFGSRDTPGVDVPIPWDMATREMYPY